MLIVSHEGQHLWCQGLHMTWLTHTATIPHSLHLELFWEGLLWNTVMFQGYHSDLPYPVLQPKQRQSTTPIKGVEVHVIQWMKYLGCNSIDSGYFGQVT